MPLSILDQDVRKVWEKTIEVIKTGNIAYELCRPQDVYSMWFSKIIGERLSATALRFLPVLIIAMLIPKPYTLNLSITLCK